MNLAVLIRHSLKYKNTVSQKSFYRDKTSDVFKDFKRRKGSQVERRRRGRWERGAKGWPYRRLLPPTDTQALRDFSLGFQKRETRDNAGTHTNMES